MGFQEDIEVIKKYLSILKSVTFHDKASVKTLIRHKVILLCDYDQGQTQDQSITLADNLVQALDLQSKLSDASFNLDTVKALVSKLILASMPIGRPKSLGESVTVRSDPCFWRPLSVLIHDRTSTGKSLICMKLQKLMFQTR